MAKAGGMSAGTEETPGSRTLLGCQSCLMSYPMLVPQTRFSFERFAGDAVFTMSVMLSALCQTGGCPVRP